MDILDSPIKLSYNTGKLFPTNVVFIGYIFMAVSLFSLLMGEWLLAIPIFLLGSVMSFSWSGVDFHPEEKKFTEHVNYFGILPVKKTFSFDTWQFLTVIPLRVTSTVYSRSTNYTNITDFYHTICLLNGNYRNKKELLRFESKSRSEETAKNLCFRMGLEYFEYNPQRIREAYRR